MGDHKNIKKGTARIAQTNQVSILLIDREQSSIKSSRTRSRIVPLTIHKNAVAVTQKLLVAVRFCNVLIKSVELKHKTVNCSHTIGLQLSKYKLMERISLVPYHGKAIDNSC